MLNRAALIKKIKCRQKLRSSIGSASINVCKKDEETPTNVTATQSNSRNFKQLRCNTSLSRHARVRSQICQRESMDNTVATSALDFYPSPDVLNRNVVDFFD